MKCIVLKKSQQTTVYDATGQSLVEIQGIDGNDLQDVIDDITGKYGNTYNYCYEGTTNNPDLMEIHTPSFTFEDNEARDRLIPLNEYMMGDDGGDPAVSYFTKLLALVP
jgi:hypothetical protein